MTEMSLNTAIEITLKRADGGFLNYMKYVPSFIFCTNM